MLEVDHVRPVDAGGTDDLENLATLCQRCNRGKSNLQLRDYRSLSMIPDDLRREFKFYHDPKPGDLERFHLYLYFTDRTGSMPVEGKFHREWIIPGSEWDPSPDKEALAARRRSEEEERFEQEIRSELAGSQSRLARTERGLERVSAAAKPSGRGH